MLKNLLSDPLKNKLSIKRLSILILITLFALLVFSSISYSFYIGIQHNEYPNLKNVFDFIERVLFYIGSLCSLFAGGTVADLFKRKNVNFK
jgi:preprotein translocase subunit SecY